MQSASRRSASRRKTPNLICRLHITSGFGVRPVRYSSMRYSTTSRLYSFSKFQVSKGMPSFTATRIASRRSSSALQGIKSGCQTFMKTPVTSYPSFCKSKAATEEATPPDIATKTFFCFSRIRRPYSIIDKILPLATLGMDIVFGPDKEVKRMDGDLGGIGILLVSTLAAVGAGESAAEITPRRIVVFAPIGGMRNPERLTDEEGKALILGTLPPGE